MEAAKAALVFDHCVPGIFTLIRLNISYIRKFDEDMAVRTRRHV